MIRLALAIILAASAAHAERLPFTCDCRRNPAIITFDNGCRVTVTNSIGEEPPRFTMSGNCSDWRAVAKRYRR